MLEMDENDGFTALKIVLVVTMLTGFIGYSDFILQKIKFWSFFTNSIIWIVFNLVTFISISRPTVRLNYFWRCFFIILTLRFIHKTKRT